jgi:hypothetical protein
MTFAVVIYREQNLSVSATVGRLSRSSVTAMQCMQLIRSNSARDKRVPNGDLANLLAILHVF